MSHVSEVSGSNPDIVQYLEKKIRRPDTGFHLGNKEQTWDFNQSFSVGEFVKAAKEKGPTLFQMLMAAGVPYESQAQALQHLRMHDESVVSRHRCGHSRPCTVHDRYLPAWWWLLSYVCTQEEWAISDPSSINEGEYYCGQGIHSFRLLSFLRCASRTRCFRRYTASRIRSVHACRQHLTRTL